MIPQESTVTKTAAENLVGQTLADGWLVIKQLPKPGATGAEDLTGSHFSIGYIASKGGKNAFLKVIDVEEVIKAAGSTSMMDRLKLVTDSHTFECSILDLCTKAKLDRIVSILAKGELPPPPGKLLSIPYILFELADGDVRKIVSRTHKIQDVWRLQVLHNIAVGLQQLHSQHIAHQDLKPSNILIFDQDNMGAKIGDLGRASQKGKNIYHDDYIIAGAINYAPPEQAYGITAERWEDRREGCDLYHLGGLATFIFTGRTPTDYYVQNLRRSILPSSWGGESSCDYHTALPILKSTFTAFVEAIQIDLPRWAAIELSQIIINACDPDYMKRGDPSARKRTGSPIGIEIFISKFDRLAKRALNEANK